MLASNRCAGARGSWWATHAMIHSFSWASPLSLRDSVAGAVASGHVWSTASSAHAIAAHDQPRTRLCIDRLALCNIPGWNPGGVEDESLETDVFVDSGV